MKNCQTIIFSRNRALQLHLCLTTLLNHCEDIIEVSNVTVLYRNDPIHEPSYDILMSEFPQISFRKEENFKKDLLNLLSNESNISWDKNEKSTPTYAMFVTDDTIFTGDFSMKQVISTLIENNDCIGFSLRLGNNTNYCFSLDNFQEIPKTQELNNNILKYNWTNSQYDFGYSLELSSSVYPLENIIEILINCDYSSPNTLESVLSSCCLEYKPELLMFKNSLAFSAPLNLVQVTHKNRNAGHDPDTFRRLYEKGIRFDDKQFDKIVTNSAHWIPENIEVININE